MTWKHLVVVAGVAAGDDTWCPTLGDFDIAWGGVQGEGNGWRVNGEGGVHGRTSWNLLGGYIELDFDACGGVPGFNNNFYTVSPEGGMASGYCDIQSNDSPICMELDIDENNGNQNGRTTWHVWGNKDGGCDQNGCYGGWNMDGKCKYHLRTEFHEDGGLTQYRDGEVVQVNGGPSDKEKSQIKATLERLGAALISTQWKGWCPPPMDPLAISTHADPNDVSYAVTNVVVHAPKGITFGPHPPTCPAPGPPTPPPPPGKCEIFVGKNNDGTNLHSTADQASGADDCCDKCSAAAGCVGFTWVHANGECWLKSAVDAPRDDQCGGCVTSGAINSPPAPTPAPPSPTPSPTPPAPPSPTPSPTPHSSPTSNCPGGSVGACVAECPRDPLVAKDLCQGECMTRCVGGGKCTGGDDGKSLEACCHNCPSAQFGACVSCCASSFPSLISV